jgi:hypothetical protein
MVLTATVGALTSETRDAIDRNGRRSLLGWNNPQLGADGQHQGSKVAVIQYRERLIRHGQQLLNAIGVRDPLPVGIGTPIGVAVGAAGSGDVTVRHGQEGHDGDRGRQPGQDNRPCPRTPGG